MKFLIIEDELSNSLRLTKILKGLFPECKILSIIDSVEDACVWFANNPAPDLAFFDIQLSDGLSLEIFEHVKVDCPLIFTTAYDEYAIKAFKYNSIDYLLKPIDKEEVKLSVEKFQKIKANYLEMASNSVQSMMSDMIYVNDCYKSRFLTRQGNVFKAIYNTDIAYFYINNQELRIMTYSKESFPLDYTLDEVQKMVDPAYFFRINRQFILNIKSITNIQSHLNSRLKLTINPISKLAKEIIVSREKVKDFKQWLNA